MHAAVKDGAACGRYMLDTQSDGSLYARRQQRSKGFNFVILAQHATWHGSGDTLPARPLPLLCWCAALLAG